MAAIVISEPAARQIRALLVQKGTPQGGLRVGVKGGGCSGLSYNLEFDTEVGKHDKQFDVDGVKVVVDVKSYL